jgi:hypothetical protein
MAKKTILKHFGKVANGKRVYYNFDLHAETLHDLEGQEFEEVIKLKHKKVSNDAHGYYRGGVLGECMEYEIFAGWEREEIHQHFARLFLKYRFTVKYIGKNGETSYVDGERIQSTADLSSKEMFEFCEKCIQWCAEQGIVIHSPEQYILSKYKTKTIQS